jgi:hypothetical protein
MYTTLRDISDPINRKKTLSVNITASTVMPKYVYFFKMTKLKVAEFTFRSGYPFLRIPQVALKLFAKIIFPDFGPHTPTLLSSGMKLISYTDTGHHTKL